MRVKHTPQPSTAPGADGMEQLRGLQDEIKRRVQGANALPATGSIPAEFLALAGPGFRDFTRIAASDPNIWRDILLANKTEVLTQAQHFRAALDALEHTLRTDDNATLQQLIAQASTAREQWQLCGGNGSNTPGAPAVPSST